MKPDENIQLIISNNAFVQLLAQLRKGSLATECAEKVGAVIAAVKHTGQKGKLTLTLTVDPDDKGEVRTVDILGEVTTKLPERKKKATTFFVVGEQSLSLTGIGEQPEFDFEARLTASQLASNSSPITPMPAKAGAN